MEKKWYELTDAELLGVESCMYCRQDDSLAVLN